MNIQVKSVTELLVASGSGKSYIITRAGCSCPAFKFSRTNTCKHLEYAVQHGWLDQISDVAPEPASSAFSKSAMIMRMRKEAIKQWLIRQGLGTGEKIIDAIESIMTVDKTEEDLYVKYQQCIDDNLKRVVTFNTRTGKVLVSIN